MMDNVLRGLQEDICHVYLDDIIVYSTSLQEHLMKLEKVFQRLRDTMFNNQDEEQEQLLQDIQEFLDEESRQGTTEENNETSGNVGQGTTEENNETSGNVDLISTAHSNENEEPKNTIPSMNEAIQFLQ
ncbi:hypothetical protein QE152_g35248 [Popillia japonica]|uniref:Reverse transcriptase domain-containing protein n=1 Tax=Popillia japonica TaxID=7064 RepID=A0AAW1IFY8_POPJA